MNSILQLLINWFQIYGYPVLWISIFLAAAGAPLPINLVLLATGAFSALGDFNFGLLLVTTASAAVAGDSTGYWIGRKLGKRLLNWLSLKQRLPLLSPQLLERSQHYFHKRGGWAVFLTRFLLSSLGGVVNLLAGAEVYPFSRFLAYDTAGEFIGVLLPLGLGYLFGESWEVLGSIMTNVSLLISALLVGGYVGWRLLRMLGRILRARAVQRAITTRAVEERLEIEESMLETSQILPP